MVVTRAQVMYNVKRVGPCIAPGSIFCRCERPLRRHAASWNSGARYTGMVVTRAQVMYNVKRVGPCIAPGSIFCRCERPLRRHGAFAVRRPLLNHNVKRVGPCIAPGSIFCRCERPLRRHGAFAVRRPLLNQSYYRTDAGAAGSSSSMNFMYGLGTTSLRCALYHSYDSRRPSASGVVSGMSSRWARTSSSY